MVVRGHPNRVLHLILSAITGGLWALCVWLPLASSRRHKRQLINVDEFGRVTIQPTEGRMAADISGVLDAPQLAGTLVRPMGRTTSEGIGESGSRVGGAFGLVAVLVSNLLTDLAPAILPKRRVRRQQEGQVPRAAHDGAPSFHAIAYLAVSADEVLIIQANTDLARWARIGPEVLGRVASSAVASAELGRGRWLSALRIGFADGGSWELEVRNVHRDTAEQVVRALGALL